MKSESLLQLTQNKYKNLLSFFVTLFNKSNFQKAIVCLLINRLWFVGDDVFCGDIIKAYNTAIKGNNKTVFKKAVGRPLTYCLINPETLLRFCQP